MACWLVWGGARERVHPVQFATDLVSRAARVQTRQGGVPSSGGVDQARLSMRLKTRGPSDYRRLVEFLRQCQLAVLQSSAGSSGVVGGILAGVEASLPGASSAQAMYVVWPERSMAYKVVPVSVSYSRSVRDVAPELAVEFAVITGLVAGAEGVLSGEDGARSVVADWIRSESGGAGVSGGVSWSDVVAGFRLPSVGGAAGAALGSVVSSVR